ncbi:helix-turn-helix transcriptional regulator [Candidatus Woesearchaeota archaeon]|nr:helix-turn-helix transcriptional regulator [Candidatus Woesearchaeota archaeon]
MSEESFLLVSLEEEKAKKLAQVLSNDTSRKILDYLSKKNDSTESELAKALKLPLSTAHYNMQQLVSANLVNADKYHYSEKGKEVIHYELSNKYVIIAPKTTDKLKKKLKEILPVFFGVALVSGMIHFITRSTIKVSRALPMLAGEKAFVEDSIESGARGIFQSPSEPSFALWFLYGSVFAIVLYTAWGWYLNNKK